MALGIESSIRRLAEMPIPGVGDFPAPFAGAANGSVMWGVTIEEQVAPRLCAPEPAISPFP